MTVAPEQMKQEAPPLEPQAALGRFERVQFTYKTLNGVDFEVAVIAPKTVVASAAKQDSPLLVHFHGGGLVMGTVLEPFFISLWSVLSNPLPSLQECSSDILSVGHLN